MLQTLCPILGLHRLMDLWGLPLALGCFRVGGTGGEVQASLWFHFFPADSPSHTGELVTREEGSPPPQLLRTASLGTKEFMKGPPQPSEGQLLRKRADSSRRLLAGSFQKGRGVWFQGTVWARVPRHTSLGLVAGPPQMWTVGSLVGISESVLERSKAKASLVILCLLLGRSSHRHPHLRPPDCLWARFPWATQWRVLCLLPAPPSLSVAT